MTTPIREILAPLEPHRDRILREPMSGAEIDAFEQSVGTRVPLRFREYLAEIGLFEDLTGGATDIEVHTKPSQFATSGVFVGEILAPEEAGEFPGLMAGDGPGTGSALFPFGGDGAGNEFCLPSDDAEACLVHFVDRELRTVQPGRPFDVWLRSVVDSVLRVVASRPPNEHKRWCVQFGFTGVGFDRLVAWLESVGVVTRIDEDWRHAMSTPVGVTTSSRRIKLDGEVLHVTRSECELWDGTRLSLDMQEPALNRGQGSRIRSLDELFARECPGYTLVDYGPLG